MKDIPAYFLLSLIIIVGYINLYVPDARTKDLANRLLLIIGIVGLPAHHILTM